MNPIRTTSVVRPLAALRLRLTLWYAATLFGILLLLGGGLFVTVRNQFAEQLDKSLAQATTEIERAARIREMETASARGQVVDAVEELRIPDRTLYLLDDHGAAVIPKQVPAWIADAALRALKSGEVNEDHQLDDEHALRIRAARIQLASGATMVAVAVADKVELEDRFASLIAAFGSAAALALLLVSAGGWFLVRKATEPAEASMEQMRRFMGDAAHELRTPLTVLRTHAEVALQQPRDAARYTEVLRAIDTESLRLGRIVDDLLTLARADAGERAVEHQRLSLDDIALDAAETARTMAGQRGVEIQIEEFEEARVDGDPALLRQLVMILLDNAVKYTPRGGTVRLKVGSADGAAVLDVADTGVGIEAPDLPHVFERFFRGDPARAKGGASAEAVTGAGLGLAIAKWIADAHRAVISAESVPGAGSRFTVRFAPAASAPPRSSLSSS